MRLYRKPTIELLFHLAFVFDTYDMAACVFFIPQKLAYLFYVENQ